MIRRENHDEIRILHLQFGRGNALSPEFLRELQKVLNEERKSPPRGLVLTGSGEFFCSGLDVPALAGLNHSQIRAVLHQLYGVCRDLFAFPRPVIAAINGHAIAGGALLALACDQRLMAQGEGKLGLNESQLGLSVPPSLVELCRYTLDRPLLEKLMYGGQIYPAFKAFDMGVLDELVEADDLLESSAAAVRHWTTSITAFAEIKSRLKAPTLEAMAAAHLEDESWVKCWFRPDAQRRLKELRERIESGDTQEKSS